MSIEILTDFFFWAMLLGIGFLYLSFFAVLAMRKTVYSFHLKLFKITEKDVDLTVYYYLAFMKIILIMFGVIPWLALKMIA